MLSSHGGFQYGGIRSDFEPSADGGVDFEMARIDSGPGVLPGPFGPLAWFEAARVVKWSRCASSPATIPEPAQIRALAPIS